MPDIDAKRSHVRIAAAILATILVAATVFTYLAYTAAFTDDQGRLLQMLAPHAAQALELSRRAAEEMQPRTVATRDLKLVATR